MRLDCTTTKPSLLMLSDHFPDPDGCGRAARAWRLLNWASATHDVYLSAVTDKPVNLWLWRRVAQCANRVHIASSRWPWVKTKPFSGEATAWAGQHRFDALLATCPGAWPDIFPGNIGMALCDLATDIVHHQSKGGEPRARFSSLFGSVRQRDSSRTKAAQIMPECDHLLVASDQQAQALRGHRSKVITLPDTSAVDTWTRLFVGETTIESATPTLAVISVKPARVRQAA